MLSKNSNSIVSEATTKKLDKLIAVLAFVSPLTVLPQIINIWVHKEVEGVSVMTWLLFLIFTLIYIAYAAAHNDKRLVTMWSLFATSYVIIIVGIIQFG